MIVNKCDLAAVGVKMAQYPTDNKLEIAFCGKSNVGKSSLINSMLGRKALARTSGKPGKTRTINFYNVEDILYFVDLPGYGYAKASKVEMEKWGKMIEEYLYKREMLRSIILLIDIRHEPGENDKTMYDFLVHYDYRIMIVATKADKIKKAQLSKHIGIIKQTLKLRAQDTIIPFSSVTKQGKDELWAAIDKFIELDNNDNID